MLLDKLQVTLRDSHSPAQRAPIPLRATGEAPTHPQSASAMIRQEQTPLAENYIKNICDAEDSRPEVSRTGIEGYVHVSTLIDLCPRQYVIAERHRDALHEQVTGGHRVMFAIGRAVERHVRDQVIAHRRREGVYGLWVCPCGETSHTGYCVHSTCPMCGGLVREYHEPVLMDSEYCISGSPDLGVTFDGCMVPVEIKSKARDLWDELEAPTADHVHQALLYRWLFQRNSIRVHDEVILLYTAKDFRWGSPYKEFHVDATAPTSVALVDAALEIAAQVRDGRVEGARLPDRVCEEQDCRRARRCPVVATCFNLEPLP